MAADLDVATKRRGVARRLAVFVAWLLGIALLVAGAGSAWLYSRLRASLPILDGEVKVAGASSPVTIARDAHGVPVISGETLRDAAFGLGFVHGQERFFQMDLLRRKSAGELAEIIGPAVVDLDKANRLHRFRHHAREVVAGATPEKKALLDTYASGVNAGLNALGAHPFEYYALRVEPEPWLPEDTFLAVYSMYIELSDEDGSSESALGVMADLLPRELFAALAPAGTEWDAPIDGDGFEDPPLPGPEAIDLRKKPAGTQAAWLSLERDIIGSNNWAVAGSATADGRAILADDMHLGIQVPNTWYRASLVWKDAEGEEARVTGVTLPGTPAIVAGSNGKVAWGFTNSYGDYSDIVLVETDPSAPDSYRTPDGMKRIETVEERIAVKGGDDVLFPVRSTIWGPVIRSDHKGRSRAFAWTAHRPEATNLNMIGMLEAVNVDDAIAVANSTGIPPQNCVIADASGRIAWSIMGKIPRRIGFDGKTPVSWADGTAGWDGWLDGTEVPRVVDPDHGRIWTANARVVGGEMLTKLGDGGYDLGARARQIRDGLMTKERLGETDLLAIQLDDRAVFLERWRDLLLSLLTPEATQGNPQRAELRRIVESNWTGRASTDSAGYRLVRAFRALFEERAMEMLLAPCKAADPELQPGLPQSEGLIWRLATEKPAHLLDATYKDWDAFLLEAADRTIELSTKNGTALAESTWGARNTTNIGHPLSRAVPLLSRFLNMEPRQLPGDENMPRVQGRDFGASERMVVSPGHEAEGLFHMPVGQSGHPLSPNYRDGHEAWELGNPTPFLPGPAAHVLTLTPAAR